MDFKPTQEMLDAIGNVKKCREIKNEICPIVMKYKTEILKQMQAKPEEHLKEYSGVPEVILNPEHAWMMEKNDYISYMSRCTIEKNSHSLNVDEDVCPLLVAESNYRDAQVELLTVVEKMIRIPFKELTDEAVDVFLDCLNEMLKQLADYKK